MNPRGTSSSKRLHKPRLVLRVAFAGSQSLPDDHANAAHYLSSVWRQLAQCLGRLASGHGCHVVPGENADPRILAFYAEERPLLRLVTGLCEGADDLAVRSLDGVLGGLPADDVQTECAAVLPGALPAYRALRPEAYRPRFDELAARCAYVLALDGVLEKPGKHAYVAAQRRARAYRAQSAVLLRQADLLIAMPDLTRQGRAGGTLETAREALAFGLPVVLIDVCGDGVRLIEPDEDLNTRLDDAAQCESDTWASHLSEWVMRIVADPRTEDAASAHGATHAESVEQRDASGEAAFGHALLREYFSTSMQAADGRVRRREPSWLEVVWKRFENHVGAVPRTAPTTPADAGLEPFTYWRKRATELNYHYAGLYRGGFAVNYLLAFLAVSLAVASLVAMSVLPHEALPLTLLLLGVGKLSCVVTILRNSEHEHHGEWNDRAVDYRYLAERLRSMFFLPLFGSFRLPAPGTPYYANRVVRQSAVDWLVEAIVRAASPLDIARAVTDKAQPPASAGALRLSVAQYPDHQGNFYTVQLIELSAVKALEETRERWLKPQADYHHDNAVRMDKIHTWARTWGERLNKLVIGIVAIDLLLLILGLLAAPCHEATHVCLIPHAWAEHIERLHQWAPYLVFVAAILPAAVASLNGLRFQSECRRLSDRSAVMRVTLRGREVMLEGKRWLNPRGSLIEQASLLLDRMAKMRRSEGEDLAAWNHEALRFSETVANRMTKDVVDWSVLYAKEVPEP